MTCWCVIGSLEIVIRFVRHAWQLWKGALGRTRNG